VSFMSSTLKADRGAVADFLNIVHPGGPWVLTAIPGARAATDTRTFHDAEAATGWAVAQNADERNIYWTVNRIRGAVDKKPKKADVEEAVFLHVDIDPRKGEDVAAEQSRIHALLHGFDPAPTIIVFSGGGYQALWRLDEPLYIGGTAERWEELESYNRQLQIDLGGDNCHNVDRILRVPGTVNWPDDKKRKKGQTVALATLVRDTGEVHPLRAFTPAPATAPAAGAVARQAGGPPSLPRGDIQRLSHPDELDQWGIGEADRLRVLIIQGHDPDNFDGDRSKAVFDLCCNLHRRGVPAGLIAGIISDPSWAISEHVVEKGGRDPFGYAWRQVERASGWVAAEGEPFQTDKDGKPYVNQHNIRLALTKMGVRVRHDRFADRATLSGLEGFGPQLSDAAMTRLRLRVDEEHKLKAPKEFFCDVVEDAARRDDFHPVVDYLDTLNWDGTPRLDGWLSTYLQASDTQYTRHVGTIMLVAAVRRVRQPGCKFDEMVVLESDQGKAKSSALAVLAVHEDWFSDDLPLNAEAKLVIERTQGRWIIEAGELKGMSPKGVEHLKGFLSRRRDSSRMAYGRITHDAPRHFIVVGTTNDDKYLVDNTGNRRFWPVRVGDIDLEALARDRDQLWAEAATREAAGETIRLDRALWQAAALEQDERRVVDPFVAPLAEVFRDLQGKVRSSDVWRIIGTPTGLRTTEQERRLGAAMRDLGFQRTQARFGGDPEYCYRRGDDHERNRRIVVAWVPGEDGTGGTFEAHLEGDEMPRRQSAMRLGGGDSDDGDQPY
jgi:hypothetical protein